MWSWLLRPAVDLGRTQTLAVCDFFSVVSSIADYLFKPLRNCPTRLVNFWNHEHTTHFFELCVMLVHVCVFLYILALLNGLLL